MNNKMYSQPSTLSLSLSYSLHLLMFQEIGCNLLGADCNTCWCVVAPPSFFPFPLSISSTYPHSLYPLLTERGEKWQKKKEEGKSHSKGGLQGEQKTGLLSWWLCLTQASTSCNMHKCCKHRKLLLYHCPYICVCACVWVWVVGVGGQSTCFAMWHIPIYYSTQQHGCVHIHWFWSAHR